MSRVVLLFAVLLTGCAAPASLPPVQWNSTDDALAILRRRADALHTVSAEGLITLERPDGESVRMDLAMVRQGSNRLRLRAWKLTRAVFDLTATPDGVFLLTAEEPSLKAKSKSAGLTAKRLADMLELFNGQFFHRDDLKFVDTSTALIVSDSMLRCDVDRRSLTPMRFTLLDTTGKPRFTLDLSDYRQIAGEPVPFRYVATSDDGRIIIALREVELNTDLPVGAFMPPKRAEKLP